MKNQKAYSNLAVWQESLDFVKDIYLLTDIFPEEEQNGIIKQLKENVISIPTNISKALLHHSNESLLKYFHNALDCLAEIDTLLIISLELEYLKQNDTEKYQEKIEKIKSLILAVVKKFERDI